MHAAITRRVDHTILALVVLLTFLAPLAIGSVMPWAYVPVEAAIFAMLALWIAAWTVSRRDDLRMAEVSAAEMPRLALPLGIFLAFLIFQLLPLPPAALGRLSPRTYRLYQASLPGWPIDDPYRDLLSMKKIARIPELAPSTILPTADDVRRGAMVPFPPNTARQESAAALVSERPGEAANHWFTIAAPFEYSRWRPITIGAELTWSGLLGFVALASLFLLVAFYPARSLARTGDGFARAILLAIVATGVLAAAVGIVETVTWNGRVLWFYVPLDWGAPQAAFGERARGPFVNPNHFAGFLGMIFPLAMSCAIFPSTLAPRKWPREFQLLSVVGAFVIFIAVVMSESRAGWMGLVTGGCLLPAIVLSRAEDYQIGGARQSRARMLGYSLAGLSILLVLALAFIGSEGRINLDQRVQGTLTGNEGWDRLEAWKGGLRMFRDYPLFGVGLGSWPELFTRYQSPPWSAEYFSEAHNDYVQLIAECGLIGFALLAWFLVRTLRTAARGVRLVSSRWLAPLSALIAGISVIAVVEFFDFDLQVPANAVLFVILLALAVRLAIRHAPFKSDSRQLPRLVGYAGAAAAVLLLVLALVQAQSSYPYNLGSAATPAEARSELLAYPADSFEHTSTISSLGDRLPPAERLRELRIATALDPLNPYTRDAYAQALEQQGDTSDALAQITVSVAASPDVDTHDYLSRRLAPWLSPAEQSAVEAGFRKALADRNQSAAEGLGVFYDSIGRFSDEARTYSALAARQDDPSLRQKYLVFAADAFVRGGDGKRAQKILREVIVASPDDPEPYQDLVKLVIEGPDGIRTAKAIVQQGIANGASADLLLVAFGELAEKAGYRADAEQAFQQALDNRPSSYDAALSLGRVCKGEGKYDRAVLAYQRALELRPNSFEAAYELGLTQEAKFDYSAADQSFRRALLLAPNDQYARQHYAEFQHNLASGAAALKQSRKD